MDIFVAQLLYSRSKRTKEGFNEKCQSAMELVVYSMALMVSVVITIWAVGSSWHCNTMSKQPFVTKLFYSLLAYMFSGLYLVGRVSGIILCR